MSVKNLKSIASQESMKLLRGTFKISRNTNVTFRFLRAYGVNRTYASHSLGLYWQMYNIEIQIICIFAASRGSQHSAARVPGVQHEATVCINISRNL